jgi:hypothetical protein
MFEELTEELLDLSATEKGCGLARYASNDTGGGGGGGCSSLCIVICTFLCNICF